MGLNSCKIDRCPKTRTLLIDNFFIIEFNNWTSKIILIKKKISK